MDVRAALNAALNARVRLVAEGAGIAVEQVPPAGTPVGEWGEVKVRFDADGSRAGEGR
jgi:hypothetical protein